MTPTAGSVVADDLLFLEGELPAGFSLTVDGESVAVKDSRFRAGPFEAGEGERVFLLVVETADGERRSFVHRLVVDRLPPRILIEGPRGALVSQSPMRLKGSVNDPHLESLTLDGRGVSFDEDGRFEVEVDLDEGQQALQLVARDRLGHETSRSLALELDTRAPTPRVILNGLDQASAPTAFNRSVELVVTATDADTLELIVDGSTVARGENRVTARVSEPGSHVWHVVARDAAGNETRFSRTLEIDRTPPTFSHRSLSARLSNTAKTRDSFVVEGRVDGASKVTVDGRPAELVNGTFRTATLRLTSGDHELEIVAEDAAGNTATTTLMVKSDPEAPVVSITSPADGAVFGSSPIAVSGTAVDLDLATVTINGQGATLSGDAWSVSSLSLVEGPNTLTATATDGVGNSSQHSIQAILDTTAPILGLSVNGATLVDGAVFAGSITPEATTSDATDVELSATLDGLAWTLGTTVDSLGSHQLEVTATDQGDNSTTKLVSFTIEGEPPVFESVTPAAGSVVGEAQISLQGRVSGAQSLEVDGQDVALVGQDFVAGPYTLTEGSRTFNLVATSAGGQTQALSHAVTFDATAPVVTIGSPANDQTVSGATQTLQGTVTDAHLESLEISGLPVVPIGDPASGATWSVDVTLAQGENVLVARGVDAAGHVGEAELRLTLDDRGPRVEIIEPEADTVVSGGTIEIHGRAFDAHLDRVEVHGGTSTATATLDGSRFSALVSLAEGSSILTVEAFDTLGHSGTETVEVERDDSIPALTIDLPAVGTVTAAATVDVSGTVEDGATVTVNGADATVTTGTWSLAAVDLDLGENLLIVRATDAGGEQAVRRRTVTRDADTPSLVGSRPSHEAVVPRETIFELTFSEAMDDPVAGVWRLETAAGQVLGSSAVLDPDASPADTVLRVSPDTLLPAGTELHLVLTDQLTDLAGFALAPVTLTFYTESTDGPPAPVILTPVPAALCAQSLTLSGSATAGNTVRVTGGLANAETVVAGDGTFDLSVDLIDGRLHRLEVRAFDSQDRASEAVTFELTQDCTAPGVTQATLSGNAIEVAFDETIAVGTAQITVSDASGALAGTVSDASVDGRTVLTWIADAALPTGTLRLELAAGVADAAGNATVAPYVRLFGDGGADTFLSGTVVDESTGRPLAGALVRITATDGVPSADPVPEQTTGEDGRFSIAVTAGTHDLTISKPSYTPVFRVATTTAGEGTDVFTPRLQPIGTAETLDAAGGSIESDAVGLAVAAGLLTASSEVTLSELSEQALPALLPYGWSPRGGAWIDLGASPDPAAVDPSTLHLPVDAPSGTLLTAIRLDFDALQWRVVAEPTASAGSATLDLDPSIFSAGAGLAAIVVVQADTGIHAPPAPVVGEVLGSSSTPSTAEVGAAGLSFSPEMVLPTQTSDVTVTYDLTSTQPSGVPLLVVVQEELELLDGTIRREAPYQAHLVLYHDAQGRPTSHFKLQPSLSAQSRPIRLGAEAVTVLRYTDESVRGNVLGPDGGSVVGAGGDVLSVPAGALGEPTAVTLDRLTVGDLPLAAPRTGVGGGAIDAVIRLDLAGQTLAAAGTLSIPVSPVPAVDARGLLLHVVQVEAAGGLGWAYRPVAELAPSAAGWVTLPIGDPAVDPDALPWPGLREDGQYVALRLDFEPAFVRGTALDLEGLPMADALISSPVVDWIQLSASDGAFVLPVPAGSVDLTIFDAASGNSNDFVVEAVAGTTHDLEPQIDIVGPTVVSTTPVDGAEVPAGINPQVSFSEAIDPAGAETGISLTRDGEPVPLGVSVSGSLLTVLPESTLAPGATYELRIFSGIAGAGIRDLQGYGLDSPTTVRFTVGEVTLPNSIDLDKVLLLEPSELGAATVVGDPGAVPAGSLVWAENLSSYQTTESTQASQSGSFSIQIGASVEDEILFHVLVEGANEVIKVLGPFLTSDRRGAWVGPEAAAFETVDGIRVSVHSGTFEGYNRVHVEPKTYTTPPSEWPAPGVLDPVSSFALDLGEEAALKPIELSLPAPPGAEDRWYLLARAWDFYGQDLWSLKDLMVLQNGYLTTDPEAPAPGGSSLVVGGEASAAKSAGGSRVPTKSAADPRDHTVGTRLSGVYTIFKAPADLGFAVSSMVSDSVAYVSNMAGLVVEHVGFLADSFVTWALPFILGEGFSIYGRDAATGFETFREVFDPQSDPVLNLPAPIFNDRGAPVPMSGSGLFHVIPGVVGERQLTPNLRVTIGDGSDPALFVGGGVAKSGQTEELEITFTKGSLQLLRDPNNPEGRLSREVKLFPLSDPNETEMISEIGIDIETQDVTLTHTVKIGNSYMLVIGPVVALGGWIEQQWNELLDEELEGFQVLTTSGQALPTSVEPVGSYRKVRIRPAGGFKAGEIYELEFQSKIKDISGNYWLDSHCVGDTPRPYPEPCDTRSLTIEAQVEDNGIFAGRNFERVHAVERMGSLLFVAADQGLWVLDATDPRNLKNFFANQTLHFDFPHSDTIRGLAFDGHGRLLVSGGGAANAGRVQILDTVLLDPAWSTTAELETAWRGITVVSNPVAATELYPRLPAGWPSHMEILSRDVTSLWRAGWEEPLGLEITPPTIPDLGTFTLGVSGIDGFEDRPVSLRNLTRGTWTRTDTVGSGSYSLEIEASRGDQIQLVRNADTVAYVQLDDRGVASLDVNRFDGTTEPGAMRLGGTAFRILEEIELSNPSGDTLCDPNGLYLKDDLLGNIDLGLLGRPDDGPWHVPVLIRSYGLVMLHVPAGNPLKLEPMAARCGVMSNAGAAQMSGMTVIENVDAQVIYNDDAVIPAPEDAQEIQQGAQTVRIGREERDYVVMGTTHGWILVVDVTERSDPRVVAKIELPAGGIAGPMAYDRVGRRLLISGFSSGLWVVNFDNLYPLAAINALTETMPNADGDAWDDRILHHIDNVHDGVTQNINLRPHIWSDLGLAWLGGQEPSPSDELGLSGWNFGAPRASFMGAGTEQLVRLDKVAPFGVPTADIPGVEDTEYPGLIRVEMFLPGRVADTAGELKVDLLALTAEGGRFPDAGAPAANGPMAKLPTTALEGEDALSLRRQSDDPRQAGYNLFISEPVVVLADLKASHAYDMTEAEKSATGSADDPLCPRCDLVQEGIYPENLADGQAYPEILSGPRLAIRLQEATKALLVELYGPLGLQAAEIEVVSAPWDISPSITQEPFTAASYGRGEVAPGTVLHSGEFTHDATDLVLAGVGFDFAFSRSYRSQTVGQGPLGPGWDLAYRSRLRPLPNGDLDFYDGRGRRATFHWHAERQVYDGPPGLFMAIKRDGVGYRMLDRSGNVAIFDDQGRLTSITDLFRISEAEGTSAQLQYDLSGRLTGITAHGRGMTFEYDGAGRMIRAVDDTNRDVLLTYDDEGRLETVSGPEIELLIDGVPQRSVTTYGYEVLAADMPFAKNRNRVDNLASIENAEGQTWLELEWIEGTDDYGLRLETQKWGGHSLSLGYSELDDVLTTTVVDRRDKTHVWEHNTAGQATSYNDPLGNETTWQYDAFPGDPAQGLVSEIVSPSGITTELTYVEAEKDANLRRQLALPNVATKDVYVGTPGEAPVGVDACLGELAYNGTNSSFGWEFEGYHGLTHQPARVVSHRGNIFLRTMTEIGGGVVGWIRQSPMMDGGGVHEVTSDIERDDYGRVIIEEQGRDGFSVLTRYEYPEPGDRASSGAQAEKIIVEGPIDTFETLVEADFRGFITRIEEPSGAITTRRVNGVGWLLQECVEAFDVAKTCTDYSYDAEGQLLNVWQPYGAGQKVETSMEYGLLGELKLHGTELTPEGNWVYAEWTYDEAKNVLTEDVTGRAKVTHTYDDRGMVKQSVVQTADGTELKNQYTYTADGQLSVHTDPTGQDWETVYDGYGRPMFHEDPLGNVTRIKYDSFGDRPAETIHCESGKDGFLTKVTTEFDPAGRLVKETQHSGDSSASATREFGYDSLGWLLWAQDARGDRTERQYDALGRLLTQKRLSSASVLQMQEDFSEFDANGNPETMVQTYPTVVGDVTYDTTYSYDALGRLLTVSDGLSNSSERAYDLRGNVEWVSDPSGFNTTFTYDGLDRPLTITRSSNPATPFETYTYEDNAADSAVVYKDGFGNQTRYEYDGIGRQTSVAYADGETETYTYDLFENTATTRRGDGTEIVDTYDAVGQLGLRSITPAEGIGGNTLDTTYSFDGIGRPKSVIQGTHVTSWTYDGLSRLKTDTSGGHTVTYPAYDLTGRPTQIDYSSTLSVSQTWNAAGALTDLATTPVGSEPIYVDYQWQGAMPSAKEVSTGPALNNSTLVLGGAWAYDEAKRVESSTFSNVTGQLLLKEKLSHDSRGLLTSQQFLHRGKVGWSWQYDDVGRLTDAQWSRFDDSGEVAGPLGQWMTSRPTAFSFTVDAMDNLLGIEETLTCGPNSVDLPLDGSGRNRPGVGRGAEVLEWNDVGNLVRKGDLHFAYDYLDRLVEVKRKIDATNFNVVATYDYDALNRRVRRTTGGTTYRTVWDGWRPIEQYLDVGGQEILQSRRIYGAGLDEMVAFETRLQPSDAGLTGFVPLYDVTGNLVVITDLQGKPVERYEYSPNGERFIWADETPPEVAQVRLDQGKILVELTEQVVEERVQSALENTLYLENVTKGIDLPFDFEVPVTEGRMAQRRWVITPKSNLTPEQLEAGDQLRLHIPASAVRDFFDNALAADEQHDLTWSAVSSTVLADTQMPELLEACQKSGSLHLTFSETPDLSEAANQILVDGATVSWNLENDGYTLSMPSSLAAGSHTVSFEDGPFDLAGNALNLDETLTFTANANQHIWAKPLPQERAESAIDNPFGFKGLPVDEETGFVYMRNRYYDPSMGRFLTTDPMGYLDSPSTYQHALNDPVNLSDPTGEFVVMAALAAVGGSVAVGWGINQLLETEYTVKDGAIDATLGVASLGLDKLYKMGKFAMVGGKLAREATEVGVDVVAEYGRATWHGESIGGGDLALGAAINFGIGRAGAFAGGRFRRGCNCFTEGTEILTAEGPVSIEDIKRGDRVWARNAETGENELALVLDLFTRTAPGIYHIRIGEQTIEATAEHPFHVPGKGWVEARNLDVGDAVSTFDEGVLTVASIEYEEGSVPVFNFEVEGLHNYFVSAGRVLVHNTEGCRIPGREVGREGVGRPAQVFTPDLTHVTGKGAAARNRAIQAVIEEDLPDLRLTFTPEYSPFIRTGIASEGAGTQIGKTQFSSRKDLRNTIIHEELHHRWWARGKYNHHPRNSADEALFYEVIRRYERLRGFLE